MRIRSIKPEFWASEDIAALPWNDRLLFIGLWSYVDDNGVGRDVEKLITADLFPLEDDPRDTLATVSRGLQELSERNLITRYEVDGKPYLSITSWAKHQRIDKPAKARYPLDSGVEQGTRDTLATPSRQSRDRNRGTEEQRNRGTEEKETTTPSSKPDFSDDFIEFYLAYPRKGSRATAATAYTKARAKASHQDILDGAVRYAYDPNREAQYTKLAATWLNQECWDDDPQPARGAPPTRAEQNLARGAELLHHFQSIENQQKQIGA